MEVYLDRPTYGPRHTGALSRYWPYLEQLLYIGLTGSQPWGRDQIASRYLGVRTEPDHLEKLMSRAAHTIAPSSWKGSISVHYCSSKISGKR